YPGNGHHVWIAGSFSCGSRCGASADRDRRILFTATQTRLRSARQGGSASRGREEVRWIVSARRDDGVNESLRLCESRCDAVATVLYPLRDAGVQSARTHCGGVSTILAPSDS